MEENGKWQNRKFEKALGVKPGIYNLDLAAPAERRRIYEGLVLHADNYVVYQQIGKDFVAHARKDLDKLPVVGGTYRIQHANKKATVALMRAKKPRAGTT